MIKPGAMLKKSLIILGVLVVFGLLCLDFPELEPMTLLGHTIRGDGLEKSFDGMKRYNGPNKKAMFKNRDSFMSKMPIDNGEQFHLFSHTEFRPECCPSVASNRSGCACITHNQLEFMGSRGGNS